MGLGISMLIMKSFLSIYKGLTNDEMQCVIAGENLVNVFPGHLPDAIKTGSCMRNYIVIFWKMIPWRTKRAKRAQLIQKFHLM